VDVEQLLGQVLSRDITQGAQVDGAIDEFIEKRHRQRVKEEGERQAEEMWKESTRKHAEKQRQQARLEWHLHHQGQAERLRRTLESLIEHHEEQASKLGGDAA
jgi:DNA repair photolyase